MRKNITAVLTALAITGLFSCNKAESDAPLPSAEIVISAPATGQVYHPGDTLHIMAAITGELTLHGYDLAIVNAGNGDTVFQAASHVHAAALNVEEKWVNAVPGSADLALYISSAINHEGLAVKKEVNFKSQPF